jgi:SAM-dependent methyltransferase
MTLRPRPAAEYLPPAEWAITREVESFAPRGLAPWEAGYLGYHWRRFQDTVRLLPEGGGRRLLDVGAFPGHLSALAHARGWRVTGLNNAIESGDSYQEFLRRCRDRQIEILACEVEREPFPLATGSMDAVMFCELFEHLHWNPFHTLKEIFRVLRPGGMLLLTTPNYRRAETLFRYFRGWGYQPPVSRTFHELWPSLYYHRHNREYTANELLYYLSLQGKDLYDFRTEPVCFSDCLDGEPDIPVVLGQRRGLPERVLGPLLRRLAPGTRGQLMVRAWRSGATLVEWGQLGNVEGCGPLQEDELPDQGFTRRVTFPYRSTGPRAAFDVPLPAGEGPVLVSLMAAHLAPEGGPALQTRWSVDGSSVMDFAFKPGYRAVRVRILVPPEIADRGRARISLTTTSGSGAVAGPVLGGQWLIAERLPTAAAVEEAFTRLAAEQRAEEGLKAVWQAAESLIRYSRPALWHASQELPAEPEPAPDDGRQSAKPAAPDDAGPGLLATYGAKVELKKLSCEPQNVRPGEAFSCDYHLRFLKNTSGSCFAYVHFVAADGKILFQLDRALDPGGRKVLLAGDIMNYRNVVTVPPDLACQGPLDVWFGVWRPAIRHKLGARTALEKTGAKVKVGQIVVGPRST